MSEVVVKLQKSWLLFLYVPYTVCVDSVEEEVMALQISRYFWNGPAAPGFLTYEVCVEAIAGLYDVVFFNGLAAAAFLTYAVCVVVIAGLYEVLFLEWSGLLLSLPMRSV
jgi:hypothetical protein